MKDLLKSQKTMILSTIGEDSTPYTSYAPYHIIENKAYIYLSKIADHYKNIINNENVSAMIIEDEAKCKQKFARTRVTFIGMGKKIDNVPQEVFEAFDLIDGKEMMNVLKTLDFDWFEIDIKKGRFVEGFAKAYDVEYKNNEWQQVHVVSDKGHKR